MEKHLYVIGNGFDIHHCIKSSYSDFRKWMQKEHPDVMTDFEEAYGECDDEWWADFENQLASLCIIEYADNIAYENQPDLMSDHCDRTWNDAQIEVEQSLDSLYANLKECFHDWILQLEKPSSGKKIKMEIEGSVFLNFNYTKTLENLYGIKPENILHIHGGIDCDENFIIGHGKTIDDLKRENPEETPDLPENLNEEEYAEWWNEQINSKEFHEQLAEEAAFQGVASQRKPVEQIIQKNNKFFCNLSNITHIHVYGMSFSGVDAPYLKLIAKEAKNAEWEFSDYKKDNERKIKKFIQENGIGMHRIIELNDILENKQLDIDFL